jgi:hypothetical protein
MLVPGVLFDATGFVDVAAGATPDFINQGFGFLNNGALVIDTGAPSGSNYVKGFRTNTDGAVYATLAPATIVGYIEGIPMTADGQIVFEAAAAAVFSSRNPITADGNFAAN